MKMVVGGALILAIVLTLNMPTVENHKYEWKHILWELITPDEAYAAAHTKSCRCRKTRKIIRVGDSAGRVMAYCGEPDSIVEMGTVAKGRYSANVKPRYKGGVKVRGSYTEATVEGYIYEYYNTRLPLRIYVLGGQVVDITIGD